MQSFDLLTEPWVSVRMCSGERKRVGLLELFSEAHLVERLDFETAAQSAAVQRLLIALTYRVTGLDSASGAAEWQSRRNILLESGKFDGADLKEYFDKYADRFDLFDEKRPFAQDPRLPDEGVKLAHVGKLVSDMPAGNNVPWFIVDSLVNSISAADAASWLLVRLTYSPGGATGSRRGSKSSVTMPPRGRMSYFLDGGKLHASLLFNLIVPVVPSSPVWWECDLPDVEPGVVLSSFDDVVNRSLGRWRHAFLLKQSKDGKAVDGVWPSWMFNKADDLVLDPHLAYRTTKVAGRVEKIALTANSERQLWRDLDALGADRSKPDGSDPKAAWAVLEQSTSLPREHQNALRVVAFAYAAGGSFQSNEEGWWRSITPEPVGGWLNSSLHERTVAAKLTEHAESLSAALGSAFGVITKATQLSVANRRAEARSQFFSKMESLFWATMDGGDIDDACLEATIFALDAFAAATDDLAGSPRFAASVAKGRVKVASSSKRKKATTDKEQAR